jgi:transcriptional regulator with XRE-family HTH domain
MDRPLIRSYLRTRRLEHGFSQAELAELANIDADTLGAYEREVREVSARMLIAGELLFGEHASSLFPDLYKRVQDEIGARALAMYERLQDAQDEASKKKLRLLAAIPARTHQFEIV